MDIEEMTKIVVEEQLSRILQPVAHEKWWGTMVPSVGYQRPIDLIKTPAGRGQLLTLVTGYLDPSFS